MADAILSKSVNRTEYLTSKIVSRIGATLLVYTLVTLPLAYLLGLVAGIAYQVYFWTTSGQTPGKMVMGLKAGDGAFDLTATGGLNCLLRLRDWHIDNDAELTGARAVSCAWIGDKGIAEH